MLNSIALIIQEKAKENPNQTAIVVGEEKCSYSLLAEMNRKAALFLKENGLKEGDRIVVEADHILSYVYIWYGIQLLGATFVPVEKNTPSLRVKEIADELEAAKIITLSSREDLEGAWALDEIIKQIKQTCEYLETHYDDRASLCGLVGLLGMYSDEFKGVHGVRPRGCWYLPDHIEKLVDTVSFEEMEKFWELLNKNGTVAPYEI
jgi:acyl-CoA synthetase (AMP-forming)/AMP-acid ligase II